MAFASILALIQTLIPLGTNIFLEFKKNPATGNVDITVTISQADAAFTADIQQAQAWMATHPVTPAP